MNSRNVARVLSLSSSTELRTKVSGIQRKASAGVRSRGSPQSAIRNPQSKIKWPQQVVPVAQAPTNSGTKTAPFSALSRCGSVDSQRLTKKREPPAVPGGARVCDRSNGQIHHQKP